jgi:hypothetical protein
MQAQAKTLRMIKKSLHARLAPTKAPHLHVRMTGYSTSQEAEEALLAAKEMDVPYIRAVRSVTLPSARAIFAAAQANRNTENSDRNSRDWDLSSERRSGSATEQDSGDCDISSEEGSGSATELGSDEAGQQLLRSPHAVCGSATDEGEEEDGDDLGDPLDNSKVTNFMPAVTKKRKRDHDSEDRDSPPARCRRVDDSDVD